MNVARGVESWSIVEDVVVVPVQNVRDYEFKINEKEDLSTDRQPNCILGGIMGAGLPAKNRRMALMELMILHPELSGKEIGAMVQLSKSRTSAIMHDPMFVLAFEKYREQHSNKISDLRAELDNQIKEATRSAIKASKDIIEHAGADMPTVVKQASISQILAQGHAKAVEKSAHMEVAVPQELIRELLSVSREMLTPIIPVKRLERIHEEDSEIVDAQTS